MTTIRSIGPDFERWDELLALILEAFAFMEGRIDPPSSAQRLTTDRMAAEAAAGPAFLAEAEGSLVGCLFCRPKADALYLGKLAVRPDRQGEVNPHRRQVGMPDAQHSNQEKGSGEGAYHSPEGIDGIKQSDPATNRGTTPGQMLGQQRQRGSHQCRGQEEDQEAQGEADNGEVC